MAQHETYNIPDQSGSAFRLDLNRYLKALISNNSGQSPPTVTAPGMFWYDELEQKLKVRNSTDSAWTYLMNVATGEVSSVNSTSDASTIAGNTNSITKVPNTLVQRDSSGYMQTDVKGNCPSADVQAIDGLSLAELNNTSNLSNRDYINVTRAAPLSDYFILGGRLDTDFRGIYFNLPFKGEYAIYVWIVSSVGSTSSVVRFQSSTQSVVLPKDDATGSYKVQTGSSVDLYIINQTITDTSRPGSIISFEGINNAANNVYFAVGCSNFGFKFTPASGYTLADVMLAAGSFTMDLT